MNIKVWEMRAIHLAPCYNNTFHENCCLFCILVLFLERTVAAENSMEVVTY